MKGLIVLIPKLRENGRGWAVKLGGKMMGEEKVLEIMQLMVCNNHPVSADRDFNMVLHASEG